MLKEQFEIDDRFKFELNQNIFILYLRMSLSG